MAAHTCQTKKYNIIGVYTFRLQNNLVNFVSFQYIYGRSWADFGGARGGRFFPFFLGFFRNFLKVIIFRVVFLQPHQGCSYVVGMERGCTLAKTFFRPPVSEFSGSALSLGDAGARHGLAGSTESLSPVSLEIFMLVRNSNKNYSRTNYRLN